MEEEGVSNSVNLRDIGENAGGIAKNRVFRSSQFYSLPLQQKHVREVSTVLDLRREGSPCKRSRLLLKFIVLWKSWPELFTEGKTNSHSPYSCAKCESRLKGECKEVAKTQVFHLDLVTLGFKRRVFQAVPLAVKLKAIGRLATFRSPEPVLAEKVADPEALGYKKLYVLFLEQSRGGLQRFSQCWNRQRVIQSLFTVSMGNAHGGTSTRIVRTIAKNQALCLSQKDRTGMVVMLLLLLCDVDQDVIVTEYMMSASCMSSWRQYGNDALDAHLQTPKVLSVDREYIYAAMEHIHSNYSGIQEYLESCSVSRSTQAAVKTLLQTDHIQGE